MVIHIHMQLATPEQKAAIFGVLGQVHISDTAEEDLKAKEDIKVSEKEKTAGVSYDDSLFIMHDNQMYTHNLCCVVALSRCGVCEYWEIISRQDTLLLAVIYFLTCLAIYDGSYDTPLPFPSFPLSPPILLPLLREL